MNRFLQKIFVLLAVLAACAALAGCKREAYPARAVTLLIPYGAGGTTDLTGRAFAHALATELGVPVTVVNQGGASGSIGCKTARDAAADGYTLLFMADSLGTQRVMGLSDISYNDFTPVLAVADDPKVLVAAKGSRYASLDDLIQDLRARPGKVKMSYTGPGGSGHVQGLIYERLGLTASMIAYGSGGDCLLAVLSGEVDFTNANLSTAIPYLESGDLLFLGVCADERLAAYPDVPALTESLPDAASYMSLPFTPLSLLVQKDAPKDVVETLRAAANRAVLQPSWVDYVQENSIQKLYETYRTPEETAAFYADWESKVSWLLYEFGAAQRSPAEFGIPKP